MLEVEMDNEVIQRLADQVKADALESSNLQRPWQAAYDAPFPDLANSNSARAPVPGRLDLGIRKAVEQLQSCGIETFESCEGGPGHAFPEPTVRFHGTPEAGWRAVGICIAHGFPIASLRRVWDVLDANEPTGPHWEITFRNRFD